MNISTLAKILGVTIKDLRSIGQKSSIYGFTGRNTRIPYNSALQITKIVRPEKLDKLKTDDNRIYLPSSISVGEFAETIGRPTGIVAKTLLMNGIMATLNEKIDYDTASLIASELRVEVFPENPEIFSEDVNTNMVKMVEYDDENKIMIPRNPVVTIMGHVDHGKTTLLDKIRKTNVAGGEAGAITQHISGYKIEYKGKKITFVDTPGHEAFTAMRARGSQMADFVILVVSAVEGPKPQTVEVIERCKISKVPVIVALNKIDLPDSDPERVKTEVSKYGLIPEEWGGDVPFIEISAKNSLNIEKILDTILVHSEMSELTGQTECQGQALVIESHLDRNMGVTATVLVVKDKLKVGDIIRSGEYVGKIRKLQDDLGKNIKEANIGDPVILIGLPEVVNVGEPIIVYPNPKEAQIDAQKELEQRQNRRISTFSTGGDSENQINIVLIADVSGSLEAIKEAIVKIPQEHVKIVIKQEAVGEVSEGQVDYANITKSTILAFHTKVNNKAEPLLKKFQVSIVASDVIYEILEWLQEEILKHIKHETKIMIYGKAKVLALFRSEKPHIQVFGGEVIDGKIFDNKNLRVVREGKDMGMVKIQELQKNKFKATEVNISQQFGVSATGKTKVKIGDILESIEEVIVK